VKRHRLSQYTLQDFKSSIKPGSFLYPYRTKYGWSLSSGWGSEDELIEKRGLLKYQTVVVPPTFIPNSVLRSPLEASNSITTECSKIYLFSHLSFRALTLSHRQPLNLKFNHPIGIYLGELVAIVETNVVTAKILSLDGQLIWV